MYLVMNINTTLFRKKLIDAGFGETNTDLIMDICYKSEAPSEEEDD